MNDEPQHVVTTRLTDAQYDWLRARAKQDDRSASAVLRRLIDEAREKEGS